MGKLCWHNDVKHDWAWPDEPPYSLDGLKDLPVYVWGGEDDQIVNVA